MTKKLGFTLAEVLIALTIIGVIAVLTVPSLIANIDNATNSTKLKKAYATINQVVGMSLADNGYDTTDAKSYSTQGETMQAGIMSIIARNVAGVPLASNAWKSGDGLIYASNGTILTDCTVYGTDHPKSCGYITIVTKGNNFNPDTAKFVSLDSSKNLVSGVGFKLPIYKNGVYFTAADTGTSLASGDSVEAAARVVNGTVGATTGTAIKE